jgi:hypothetical protein
MLKAFPFTLFPLIVYDVVAFLAPGALADEGWDSEVFSMQLFSGAPWSVTAGDLLIVFALGCLFLEMLRATVASRGALTNHLASVVVLIFYAVEFVVFREAATSVFFLLTVIALVDVLAGYAVSLRVASRDVTLGQG